jgi:hypothetical protein
MTAFGKHGMTAASIGKIKLSGKYTMQCRLT